MTTTTTTPLDDGRWAPLSLVAVPLNRALVRDFLRDWSVPARGAPVLAVEQRPPAPRRSAWLDDLAATVDPEELSLRLVATDATDAHLGATTTDRLVPRHLLAGDDTFLERNLGGWSPVWFGAMAAPRDHADDDPVLAAREVLVEYGTSIADAAASPDLATSRTAVELGEPDAVTDGAAALVRLRAQPVPERVAALVAAVVDGDAAPPRLLALDELLETLYRVELERREAQASDQGARAEQLSQLQSRLHDEHGVRLLLKGEYVMGRHRRSTVLLAEGLGVVVKQPAPEPDHAVELGARSHDGASENWPVALDGGRVVTPRGAIGRVVEAGAIERVNAAFGRDVTFSVTLGLSVEPFERGPTLQELAVRDPTELTPARYDEVLVHHLVCEQLGVDNPDWHAANFMVTGDGLVHVDWGAARPIPEDEAGPEHARARREQVRELAWSFQDADLAERTRQLHAGATSDEEHLDRLRARSRAVVEGA